MQVACTRHRESQKISAYTWLSLILNILTWCSIGSRKFYFAQCHWLQADFEVHYSICAWAILATPLAVFIVVKIVT